MRHSLSIGIKKQQAVIRCLALLFMMQSIILYASEPLTEAPTFYLTDLKGDDFFASKVYGEKAIEPAVVVLSFFATWCIPCRGEAPQLEILAKAFPKVQFYLVSVKDQPEKILQWLNDLDVELPVLVDKYGRTAKKFNVIGESDTGKEVASLPSLFVINKAGEIVYQHTGYKPGDELTLKQILEKTD
ncbi:MAG: TlpA family protein disulfide reductase [Calditrichaeota bacterium]|jgi:cytochrome c biogenesis protein CcmG, thiol:disulfide interchange protein DsbE|nr:TlpA family protein disulfide reductase [Calditrichota bacterium]